MSVDLGEISDDEVLARFPDVRIDHDNKAHYKGRLQRQFVVNQCEECGLLHDPPRSMCPRCWSDRIRPSAISGKGVLYMFTLLHQGPQVPGVSYAPFWPLAVVELSEQPGLRVAGTLIDCDPTTIEIGTPMELGWIDLAGVPYPAFRPAAAGVEMRDQ